MTLIAACPSEQAYLEEKTKNKPTIKQQLKIFIQELQIKGNPFWLEESLPKENYFSIRFFWYILSQEINASP